MAGAALDERRVNVGFLIAQPHLPQRRLGSELCLRRHSQNTAPGAPGLTQNTDELPVPSKRPFPPRRDANSFLHRSTKKHNFIWW